MPRPRHHLVDDERPGAYHIISRCVRRAFLCGDRAEHRRAWVRDLIRQAAGAFAVDVLAYAVMSNHLHIVIRTDPVRVVAWSPTEIATRWASAHPRTAPDGTPEPWSPAEIAERSADPTWIDTTRKRLRSLSWFMKCVKERLARRANRDDGCTGHFWEGRFQSVPLLDQGAVIAAMAYVDLNPIRAAMAETPEASDYTSVQDRCVARQAHRAAQLVPVLSATATTPETGLWIAPIDRATVDQPDDCAFTAAITLDDYLTLVDETGRIVRDGKRGMIPAHLAPILDRLRIDLDAWLSLMRSGGHFGIGSFGALASRAREALRRGARWIIDITAGLYRDDDPPANPTIT
ncbi:MAG: transposase [Planctomycetes bacterium]|nr:transposase [Planctomycetota bacterium]